MGLAEEILAAADEASAGRRPGNWFESLPTEHQDTLNAIRSRWLSTRQGTGTSAIKLAEKIVESFAAIGCNLPRKKTVAAWLTSN